METISVIVVATLYSDNTKQKKFSFEVEVEDTGIEDPARLFVVWNDGKKSWVSAPDLEAMVDCGGIE